MTRPAFTYVHLPPTPCRCDLCNAQITASVFPSTCRRCDLVIDLWAIACGMCAAGDEVIECPMCEAMQPRPATFRPRVEFEFEDTTDEPFTVIAPVVMIVHPTFEHDRIRDRVGGAIAVALATAYNPRSAA